MSIKVILPDGTKKDYPQGSTALDVAKGISEGLARNVLAAEVNGEVVDSMMVLPKEAHLKLLTWRDEEGKKTYWHSSAHLMAEAFEALYPGIKLGIGPPIANGFYYDIDFGDHHFSSDEFPKIEAKIKELAKKKSTFERSEISKADAIEYFTKKEDPYKLDLLSRLEDGTITFYNQGEFTDLCRGPHIPHTGHIKAVKLLNTAGAYWLGDEKSKQLTRVYAITFPKNSELKEHMEMLEMAKQRDHRKLGKELELFAFSQKVGQGLPLWLPKGAELRGRLENYLKKKQRKLKYQPVITPHIAHIDLYKTSGHYEKYGADAFQPIKTPHEGEEFFLKPMNCPHHCEIYKNKPHSYRDLPIRYAEFGTVYRYEQSGELHGLTRVRSFTQDDAHIFCRPDQVKEEFCTVIDLVLEIFRALNFKDYTAQVSLRDPETPEKYIGSKENWDKAENDILEAANEQGLNTVVEYGEAAFYGPKLDFMIKDAMGRTWQLGTIQLDYTLPERFKLEYKGSDAKMHRPVMIHRAPFGSMERFIALLIEHTGGNFPLWLCPDQAIVLPVGEKYTEFAKEVGELLNNTDIRALVDERNEKIGRKIRDAEVKKIPFMLIVGQREMDNNTVSVRRHGGEDLGTMTFTDFIQLIENESKP